MPTKSALPRDKVYFFETIFEDGSFSIGESTIDGVLPGLKEQYRRATVGELGGPPDPQGRGWPAVRPKRVLIYAEHPHDYPDTSLSADEWQKRVSVILKEVAEPLDVYAFQQKLLDTVQPLTTSGAHESNYHAPEIGEIDPSEWETV